MQDALNRSRGAIHLSTARVSLSKTSTALNQQQRWIFEQVAQFFQVLRAQRAIDYAVIAAHPDRHSMADYDLIAIIDYRLLGNRAHCEDKTLWWINDCGETVDPHSAEIGNSERSALK